MSTTLSYGVIKNADGDRGSAFWDDLAANQQLQNDHTHNGTNSARLTAVATDAVSQNVASGSWVASGTMYRQLLTVPTGLDVDLVNVIFRDSSTGEQYYLSTVKVNDTTFYVYINDNSKDLKAIYTT
jgi:hypothetical protein